MTFLMLRRLVLLVAALVLALTVTTQTTASAPSTRTDTRQDTVTSDLQLTPFMTLVSDRFARAGSPSTAAAGVVTMRSRSLAAPLTAGRLASWCGTVSTTDRPNIVAGYPVHVVYAIPLDGQDNSATVAPQIAADIDEVTAWWQREDPSHQPRFDFYSAPCGPQLDITFLKTSTISVGMTEAHQVHALLWNEIQNQPGATYTKFIVFLDGVNPVNVCGTGGTTQGAALGDVAMGLAVVYLDSCNGASQASVAAHEFLHSIAPAGGLVGAPHTCPGDLAHVCDSSGDVLYPYAEAGIPLNSLQLDVGHDDYYAGTAPVNLQVVPWLRAVQDQVHLTLNVSGEGTVASDVPGVSCAAPCGSDWDRGSSVELNATPTASDRFVRWDGACDGNGSCPLTLTQAAHVTAVFGPLRIPLQVSTLGRGRITCSPACTKTFTAGYFLELKAVAAKGWRFARWSGGCAGTRPLCRPPTDFALNVKATFRKRSGI